MLDPMRRRGFLTLAAGASAAWVASSGRSAAAPGASFGAAARALEQLGTWVASRGGELGAAVVDLESSEVVLNHAPARALNPASNMKILTAAVALEQLGPGYRFTTGLYGTEEGTTIPRLVLRGHGDPSFASEDLWRLARALHSRGTSRVGEILVDQSRFDDQFVPPGFEQQPAEWASFRAPVSAIALERNAVTLNVLARKSGEDARVWFEPHGVVKVEGAVATRKQGSGQNVQLSLDSVGDQLVGRVGGYVAEGLARLRFARRVDDPRRVPGLALAHMLRQLGVDVSGGVSLGGTGEKRRITYHASAPVSVLLTELGKNSDNFYAEMLLKSLGAERTQKNATSADGAKAIEDWLAKAGLARPETVIANGSGLFDTNRVSAEVLARTLARVHADSALRPEFESHLAIGGVDGTLRSRFRSLRQRRAVRAKTGTLAAADALAGYVTSKQKKFAFAILVNGVRNQHGAVRKRTDEVVTALANS